MFEDPARFNKPLSKDHQIVYLSRTLGRVEGELHVWERRCNELEEKNNNLQEKLESAEYNRDRYKKDAEEWRDVAVKAKEKIEKLSPKVAKNARTSSK
jgi:chromosome segregation ATPase